MEETPTEPAGCSTTEEPTTSSNNDATKAEQTSDEATNSKPKRKIYVAVAGCVHGEIETIYKTLATIEENSGNKVDLVICCGDFQSVRNYGDLHHMHVNQKYRQLQTFYKYYSGEKVAPYLTIFVGGNHEASGFLCELPNGGWVAPNIYYMGFASVLTFAGLRIAGLSGIYKQQDYHKGHYERPPFANGSEIAAYHVRSLEAFRLRQLREKDGEPPKNNLDMMVTHDWPAGITDYGDVNGLLRFKPYFAEDIKYQKLGNPATMTLLQELKPCYWFSAHLHCGFPAFVPHEDDDGKELNIEPTRFLALDKPIPGRHYLQVIPMEVDEEAPLHLSYDPEWLAILKSTDHLMVVTNQTVYLPSKQSQKERFDFRPLDEELEFIKSLGDLTVPTDFLHTAPPLKEITAARKKEGPSSYYRNPQSEKFCQWLGIRNLNGLLADTSEDVGTPFFLTDFSDVHGELAEDTGASQEECGDFGFVLDGVNKEKLIDESLPTAGTEMVAGSTEWTAPLDTDDLDSMLAGLQAPPDAKRSKND